MGQLGNIFEDTPSRRGAARGPDLRVQARVPRSQLGASEGVVVPVPDRVSHGAGTVPRRRGPDDPPGAVVLHLSPQVKDGATLRLRGQGGEHPGGAPGDLLVSLQIVERRPWWPWLVLALGAAAGAWASHGVWWG